MGAEIALRGDFEAADLRRLAKASKDAGQSRRLLALAEIYDGGRRSDAARIGGGDTSSTTTANGSLLVNRRLQRLLLRGEVGYALTPGGTGRATFRPTR